MDLSSIIHPAYIPDFLWNLSLKSSDWLWLSAASTSPDCKYAENQGVVHSSLYSAFKVHICFRLKFLLSPVIKPMTLVLLVPCSTVWATGRLIHRGLKVDLLLLLLEHPVLPRFLKYLEVHCTTTSVARLDGRFPAQKLTKTHPKTTQNFNCQNNVI